MYLQNLAILGLASILLSGVPSFSATGEGGSNGGGGNARRVVDARNNEVEALLRAQKEAEDRKRAEDIKPQREQNKIDLANDLKELISSGELKSIILRGVQDEGFQSLVAGSSVGHIFMDMLSKGLIQDIIESRYVLQNDCRDENNKPSFLRTVNGTSYRPIIGADICVSIDNFINEYMTDETSLYFKRPTWLYFGVFLHDHARHFGYLDRETTNSKDHGFALELSKLFVEYYNLAPLNLELKTVAWKNVSLTKSRLVFGVLDPQIDKFKLRISIQVETPLSSNCDVVRRTGIFKQHDKDFTSTNDLSTGVKTSVITTDALLLNEYMGHVGCFSLNHKNKKLKLVPFPYGTKIKVSSDKDGSGFSEIILPSTMIDTFYTEFVNVDFAGNFNDYIRPLKSNETIDYEFINKKRGKN